MQNALSNKKERASFYLCFYLYSESKGKNLSPPTDLLLHQLYLSTLNILSSRHRTSTTFCLMAASVNLQAASPSTALSTARTFEAIWTTYHFTLWIFAAAYFTALVETLTASCTWLIFASPLLMHVAFTAFQISIMALLSLFLLALATIYASDIIAIYGWGFSYFLSCVWQAKELNLRMNFTYTCRYEFEFLCAWKVRPQAHHFNWKPNPFLVANDWLTNSYLYAGILNLVCFYAFTTDLHQ